jgi:hypothetical protein
MAKRPTFAVRLARQTERDLTALRDQIEKRVLAIGGRFGDIDNAMVSQADDLQRTFEHWAGEMRAYMDECVKDDLWKF